MYRRMKFLIKRLFTHNFIISNDIVNETIQAKNLIDLDNPVFSIIIPISGGLSSYLIWWITK